MIQHASLLSAGPVLFPDLLWYWNAWCELSASRPPAMQGVARIPIEALSAFCQLTGVSRPSQQENLRTAVRMLDDELIAIETEEEARRESLRDAERHRRHHG